MNPYAHIQEEIPPYVGKTELGELMISGALAVLILCFAFAAISVGLTAFVQTLTLLGD